MLLLIDNESKRISPEIEKKLVKDLQDLPEDAKEPIVDNNFAISSFLEALGYTKPARFPAFRTGSGMDAVDYALRHNTEDNSFLHTPTNPHILVELKGRDINIGYNTGQYKSTVKQLKRYLLAPNCKSVQWGIITNSKHIQLFRKHGKVIHPATTCLEINPNNIIDIINKIREKIENTSKALTVAIYNNKGGVGKTTTVINLAATLTRHNKKVLVIDFDPNQKDLTESLDIKPKIQTLYKSLNDRTDSISLKEVICPYEKNFKGGITLSFDVIPVDEDLSEFDEDNLRQIFSFYSLRKKLELLKSDYDYILIDAPPNWTFYSISAVYAADVVLMPTKHNNIRSLKNAATSIQNHITEVQKYRQEKTQGVEWGTIALPIFFNGEIISDPARRKSKEAISLIIKKANSESKFDLIPYFFPHFKNGKNTRIFELPHSAHIASSTFDRIPAVYRSKVAYSYYTELAKEYFLQ